MLNGNAAKGTDAYRIYEQAERRAHFFTKNITICTMAEITFSALFMMVLDAVYNIFVKKNYVTSEWFSLYSVQV